MGYDCLKLDNQLCFPLYAAAKKVVSLYEPFLKPLHLTYTQYIVLLVLWEEDEINVKALGERIYLDSGTLTPLLRKLEKKSLIRRLKNPSDQRNLIIQLTKEGHLLEEEAKTIPAKVGSCLSLSKKDAVELYRLTHLVLARR